MNLVAHIRDRVAEHGDSRGLTFLPDGVFRPDGVDPVRVTYTQLDEQARATAAWLTTRGLTDQPVLLLYPPGPAFLGAFLGCLYARVLAIPAPLPQAGPRHLARVRALIRDADARLILTDEDHRDRLAASSPGIPVHSPGRDADPSGWTVPDLTADTIAYLQYTSGSTGTPRGVAVPHGAVLHNLATIHARAVDPLRVMAGWAPHYHDMGLVGHQLNALYAGADLVFTATASFVARPVRWLEMITRYRAQWTAAPDFAYALCAQRVTDEQLADLDLSSLTMAFNGGEPIRAATLDAFTRRFAPVGFRSAAWVPCYGMAEATLVITGTRQGDGATVRRFDPAALERHRADPDPSGAPLVAAGRPVDLDLRVVDPGSGEALADRRIGEIWVSGTSVTAGYRGHPQATRRTFHAGEGTYLRTGDLGFLLDGDLYVTGRLKEVIIVNGRNLYPQDLEASARLAHRAAGPGAAFAVTPAGGREHIVLVQELRGDAPDAPEVAATIIERLGQEHGISLSLVLVGPGQVRRTTSGKIRRRHMRDLFLRGRLTSVYAALEPAVAAAGPTR